ncbi:hypothetical protein IWQ57_003186 [Coemansia nantahalensis]|uniref:Uncharacterized protein n=1 Tax=Coemansia nantahalensis TaxID=2789366 RepID=A0ACC1JXG2_9FUNG|nr:hypothetical protein IWQ57_003186 [Coemansia nantahalensis]
MTPDEAGESGDPSDTDPPTRGSATATDGSSPSTDPAGSGSANAPRGLSIGAIAGIVVASLAAVGLAVLALLLWRRRRRQERFYNPDGFTPPDVGTASSTYLTDGPFALHDKGSRSRETLAPHLSSAHSHQQSSCDMSSFHGPRSPRSELYTGHSMH